jgi:hypothetical protein
VRHMRETWEATSARPLPQVHRSEADGRGFEATESSLRLMARCLAWRARCLAPKARCMGCMGSCLGGSVGARGSASCASAEPAVRRGRHRNQAPPSRNGLWTNAQLQAVLAAHERGYSVSGAAALYDIPRTSFRAHLVGIVLSHKRGTAPVLTEAKEQQLV